jgi:isopentenyl phosphate kinase
MTQKLVFLKLGGSLITDKSQPHTVRSEVLNRIVQEVATALSQDHNLRVVLGHGSGSFGHFPASKYHTRLGVKTAEEWAGFVEVWREAAELNHLVLQALERANLPAIALPPSAMVFARHGTVVNWNLETLLHALEEQLLPVIFGDVVFDAVLGGTILSTEDLFAYLTQYLRPAQLLLAGNQPGVWADFPENTRLLSEITPKSLPQIEAGLRGSAATDVTGGMADKVQQVLSLVESFPEISISIFSGEIPGNVQRALLGEAIGTTIHI